MPSPFPGMDPYLEWGELWHTLHTHMVVEICKDLQPALVPRYVASAEQRVVSGRSERHIIPDVPVRDHRAAEPGGVATVVPVHTGTAVPELIEAPELLGRQRYVTIRDRESNEVVTVIELLSPSNKEGSGQDAYVERQREVLRSTANLVEIDLLRDGAHSIAVPGGRIRPSDYRICVHRARAGSFELVRLSVREPLPNVEIPLREGERGVVLHLGEVFTRAYDGGAYQYKAHYDRDAEPPLTPEDAAWAAEILAKAGLNG